MRGRQQVYPTIECAPNRVSRAGKIPRDMPIFRGSERACLTYAQWLRETRGMSRWAGGVRVDMPSLCGSEGTSRAYVHWPGGGRGMSRGAGAEGPIGRCREVQVF